MKKWIQSGTPWIWLNAGAVTLSVIMVVGLLLLIAIRGLGHFWPGQVIVAENHASGISETVIGEVSRSETITAIVAEDAGYQIPSDMALVTRHLFKTGNRDQTGRDFSWYLEPLLMEKKFPNDIVVLERMEWGNAYGYFRTLRENGVTIAEGEEAWREFRSRLRRSNQLRKDIRHIERREIGDVNHHLERIRLEERRIELRRQSISDSEWNERMAELNERRDVQNERFRELNGKRMELFEQIRRDSITIEIMDGREVVVPLEMITIAYRPNNMNFFQKVGHYFIKFGEFVWDYPREANTEGGIFPAIFGTVMMVILMSIMVTPFGILAAIYLREYAKQGVLVRLIRISVNNLAGVPSIVFGVFGLGFFVYFMGGNIDRAFFPESLPAPTFGTPGILWSSLTLALLTLPVVIVATEEGLARIPSTIRQGSLALGATQAETLWRTVIPLATPAIMTGLILAVARAAGEVAPLMLVGVVKLAPNLPLDGYFPFIHLERKFMHLGFHIYDVGFQSPNVEAARPLVYATSLVLVIIILTLNLTAINIRNYLREKFKSDGD